MKVLLTSGIISLSSRTITLPTFNIASSTFVGNRWPSGRLHTTRNEYHLAQCFCTQKHITERDLHLMDEARGSSISNGYQAKTDNARIELARLVICRGETKTSSTARETSIQGSLVTAAELSWNLILGTILV